MKATYFCILLLAAVASADLQSDINDIISQLPQNQRIDSQKQQQPSKSNDWLEDFFKIPEVKDLVEYFERRGIDAWQIISNYIINLIKYRFFCDIFKSGDVVPSIMKALSAPKIAEIIKKKEETSSDFKGLVNALKDPEFKTLFYRALNAKAPLNNKEQQERGFFKKLWKKVLANGISVSIPFAG